MKKYDIMWNDPIVLLINPLKQRRNYTFLITLCTINIIFPFKLTANLTSKCKQNKWSFIGELHFITLNYTSNYTLHHKFFEYTFCTLNHNPCYTLYLNVKFAVNLNGKVWYHVKLPNCPSSQSIKTKKKLHFLDYTLHHKHYISIQVNDKLNIKV